jgi:hypothetical protein
MIQELRILPPLAVARLGEAPTPMDNYDVEVDPERPLSFRRLVSATTLEVDPATGEIARTFVPDEPLRFTEDGKVRPVAPFLEVWALTDAGELEPLTVDMLAAAGATPADVRWRVHLGNHKLWRRTGSAGDRIEAVLDVEGHARQPVEATCENFWPGKFLPLGHVQYVKPSDTFPEVRLRFTPAAGHVYGSSKSEPGGLPPDDPNIVEVLYDANRGTWMGYTEAGGPALTIPAQIYAGTDVPNGWESLGYLDDECDGLVHVAVSLGDRTLSAYARVGAGPPAYAPDGFPIRTVFHELEQALLGHEVDPAEATLADVEEIVRRAFETVRLMNTAVMNGNTIEGEVNVASTMVRQDTADTGRAYEPIMAPSLVDSAALENLHQSLLVALRSGTAPWFADVLREYDEIGDLTNKGRRKMPALMRNADGRALALTRRHVNLVRAAAQRAVSPEEES